MSTSSSIHDNVADEFDASNGEGYQGGQDYVPPTTQSPTTSQPTRSPTSHPTLHGRVNILRGVMWYDRNANGVRDSNVEVTDLGDDVEFSYGVGGIQVQLEASNSSATLS